MIVSLAALIFSVVPVVPVAHMQSKNLRKAPNFTYPDFNGNKHTLASIKGKVAFIDFWATWCPPCRKSIPSLAKLQKKYADKLIVIGVSYDDTKDVITDFLKKDESGKQVNYPIVFGTPLEPYFGDIEALPTLIIVDKQGNIRDTHVGTLTYEEMDQLVAKLVAE